MIRFELAKDNLVENASTFFIKLSKKCQAIHNLYLVALGFKVVEGLYKGIIGLCFDSSKILEKALC